MRHKRIEPFEQRFYGNCPNCNHYYSGRIILESIFNTQIILQDLTIKCASCQHILIQNVSDESIST